MIPLAIAAIIIRVNPQLVKQLAEINRTFYAQFAAAFSETRPSRSARLDRILAYIPNGARVLDMGCGNGRLAERLDREGRHLLYTGVDAAVELIAIANARRGQLRHVRSEFRVADVMAPDWQRDLPNSPFDVAVALAVFHHIPSFDARLAVLRDLNAILHVGGTFVMTNWHFERNERLRKKIVSWDKAGIDARAVEPGDALLDWKHGGTGYRYCHLLTQPEVQDLAAQSKFQVVEQFYADADMNLYSVLRKTTE